MGRYVFLDDIAVADCALEVEARDLNDLFETVARAVAEIMVDPATIRTTVQREIGLAASSLDLLLFDWIAELIFLKDSEQLILTCASVDVSEEDGCRLVARVAGGRIDREHTGLRADAKAPTFYRFGVQRHGSGWRGRVVIDI